MAQNENRHTMAKKVYLNMYGYSVRNHAKATIGRPTTDPLSRYIKFS